MVEVKIVNIDPFFVSGKKCSISGQDNSQFESFWELSHKDGTVDELKEKSSNPNTNCTKSRIMGVSRVEKDPSNRAFDFYIAAECPIAEGYETFEIPKAMWAIFRNTGDVKISALVDAEMYAFMEWLPKSDYVHAEAPELEVYPYNDNNAVEFWLPITEKKGSDL